MRQAQSRCLRSLSAPPTGAAPPWQGLRVTGGGRWPALDGWFAAMAQRPTFAAIQSDYYTHAHDLPPQLGGCEFNAEGPRRGAPLRAHDAAHLNRWTPTLLRSLPGIALAPCAPRYLHIPFSPRSPPFPPACARSYAQAIDGLDGASWRLPLPPLTATSLEPYPAGDAPARDRLEAAARLIGNHAAVRKLPA